MANRNFDTGWTIGKRLVDITGSFIPLTTNTGTILATGVKGLGFGFAPVGSPGVMAKQTSPVRPGITSAPGITHPSTGLYTITLDDAYRDINFLSSDLSAAVTGSALWTQPVEPWTNTGVLGAANGIAPTVQFLIINSSGSPTDASAAMRLNFYIQLEDSTVQFGKP